MKNQFIKSYEIMQNGSLCWYSVAFLIDHQVTGLSIYKEFLFKVRDQKHPYEYHVRQPLSRVRANSYIYPKYLIKS